MRELFPQPAVLSGETLTLRPLTLSDADDLRKLTEDKEVYRFLPTFLFEKKYPEAEEVIRRLYTECLDDSLILGIFRDGRFCGLAEIYAFRPEEREVSVGCRLLREAWGEGIAAEAVRLMLRELKEVLGIRTVKASTMTENAASGHVLRRFGFSLSAHAVDEDWGLSTPVPTDKWVLSFG